MNGHVVLYLGDEVDVSKIIGYWDRYVHGPYSYSLNILFQAGEEGILTNVFPTSVPTTTVVPSFLPSSFPSLEPTSPTDSPAPKMDYVKVLIAIKLDAFPSETGWMITDNDGNVIRSVSFFTYVYVEEGIIYEEVNLVAGLNYKFTLKDRYGDGLSLASGHVFLFLGDKVDSTKILGYYRSQEGLFL